VGYRYLCQDVGIPCYVDAVGMALQSNNLECLKLLLDRNGEAGSANGRFSKWELFDVEVAAYKGFAECVAFVVAHGCPYNPNVSGSNPRSCMIHPVSLIFDLRFGIPCSTPFMYPLTLINSMAELAGHCAFVQC
jgi:hypothetical protein